jgi:hypothetical protein
VAQLYDVSCTERDWCMAVGFSQARRHGRWSYAILTEAWNGTAWSVTPTAAESSADGLTDVSCTGRQWCAAVGDRITTVGTRIVHTLAEVSQGGTWLLNRTVNPSPAYSVLSGVACGGSNTGGTFCVAVGYRSTKSGGLMPLIESY